MCPFFYLLCKCEKEQSFYEMQIHLLIVPINQTYHKHLENDIGQVTRVISPGKDKVCFSQDRTDHVEKWHPGSS